MRLPVRVWIALGLLWAAFGSPWTGPQRVAGQTRPAVPRQPQLQRRTAPQAQFPPGFPVTAQQDAYLDQVLQAWEQHAKKVKTFESSFTRWDYDDTFGQPNVPRFTDQGKLKYAAPDRGMLEVTHTEKDGKMVDIEPERKEKWICNGKSVFQYEYAKTPKQLTEYPLPPELLGKAIQNGPLPFMFGAEAARLKQRYFIRVIATPPGRTGETWLEAYPRYQRDAADFRRAELILRNQDVMPLGMHIYHPGGKQHAAYWFWNIVVNDPLRFFKGDPFRASTPLGWKKVVDQPPAQQTARPPSPGQRR